jgi:hypothetical protein
MKLYPGPGIPYTLDICNPDKSSANISSESLTRYNNNPSGVLSLEI